MPHQVPDSRPAAEPAADTHPGVIIIPPRAGRPCYALRFKLNGRCKQPTLKGVTTPEAAHAAACAKSRELQEQGPQLQLVPTQQRPVQVRAERGEAQHRGITVIPPRPGRPYYALRYKDPVTGSTHQPKLPGVTTAPAAHAAAVDLFRNLQRRAFEIVVAGGDASTLVPLTVELEAFIAIVKLRVSRRGKPTSTNTINRYRAALTQFVAWCAEPARGCLQLNQLTKSMLSSWHASRIAEPAHKRTRKASTVNQEVKPVKQMLVAAAAAGRLPYLSSDAIRGALPRLTQPAPVPRCFSAPEVRAILRAALYYDESHFRPARSAPLAPVIAAGLLAGMRRKELSELQVFEVLFDAPTEYDPTIGTGLDVIRLPAEKVKTGIARDISMQAPYSPLLGELMQALTSGRKPGALVFNVRYVALGDHVKRMRKAARNAPPERGLPKGFSLKALRSTCATYQSPLKGNAKAKADRMGHTLAVAEQHYLALPSGTPSTAASLEAVMQCTPEVRIVIERVLNARNVRRAA